MNICEEYAVLIQEYLDDELPGADRARVMEHLAQCEACRAYFQQLTELQDAFAAMDAPVPAGLSAAIMEKVQTTPQLPAKKPLRWQRYGMLAACLALVCIAGFSGLFANVGSKDAAAPESASDNGAADIALFDQYAAESSKTGGDAFSGSADDMADGAGTAMESTQDNGAPAVSEEPTILVNGQAYPQASTHVLLALNRSATDDQKQFFAANSIADGDIPSNVEDPENFMLYLLPNDCYEKAVSLLEEGSYFVTVDTVREGERPGLLVMVPLDS